MINKRAVSLVKEFHDGMRRFSAMDLNAILAAAKKIERITATPPLSVHMTDAGISFTFLEEIHHFRWGIIRHEGPDAEADYSDSRYWVESAYNSNAGGGTTAEAILSVQSSGEEDYFYETCTNLAESRVSSHFVIVGEFVQVWEVFDVQNETVRRRVFFRDAPGTELVGSIKLWGGNLAAPQDWEYCNGRVASETGTFAKLYAVIGHDYDIGGEGAGNFRFPNVEGRYVRGAVIGSVPAYPIDQGTYDGDSDHDHTAHPVLSLTPCMTSPGTGSLKYWAWDGSGGGPAPGLTHSTESNNPESVVIPYIIRYQ